MRLTLEEQAILEGIEGPGKALALKIVVEAGQLLGAEVLIPITSSHIDGCIYYGDAGVHFVERLVELGAKAIDCGRLAREIGLDEPEIEEAALRSISFILNW